MKLIGDDVTDILKIKKYDPQLEEEKNLINQQNQLKNIHNS